jgi:hypothetical protein
MGNGEWEMGNGEQGTEKRFWKNFPISGKLEYKKAAEFIAALLCLDVSP